MSYYVKRFDTKTGETTCAIDYSTYELACREVKRREETEMEAISGRFKYYVADTYEG